MKSLFTPLGCIVPLRRAPGAVSRRSLTGRLRRLFQSVLRAGVAIGGACLASGCVPDVYLIDRQTVMEVEASGDWPELDEEIFQLNKRMGPVSFKKDERPQERAAVFSMTDGDYGSKKN